MKSIKEECLLQMIFFGEKMLRTATGNSWNIITQSEIIEDWATY